MKKKNNIVFISSIILTLAIVFWGFISPKTFELSGNLSFNFLSKNFNWFYTVTMTSFIVFAIWIGFFSKYKNIKLGSDDSKPEFSNASWFAMLFSAGMGIGLVFFGIAEPLSHYINPITGNGLTEEARKFAITKSFLHWGLHPWANYCILGLGLAYMQFRKGKAGLISSIFIPILGQKGANGYIGKIIDILAVFATAAGMATSLGLGTKQINSGLNFMFNIPESASIQVILVVVITIIYTWTAISGVEKGIKAISDLNLILVIVLLLGSFLLGPTVRILRTFVEGCGLYVQNFVSNSLEVGAFNESSWFGSWTVFYWAWWIAWAPFTGIFIARISKGRTIKEFVAGVMLVPTVVSFVWFAIFAGIDFSVATDVLISASKDTALSFFVVMSNIPLGAVLSFVAIILLFTFFITSANSATFVLGMLSQQGDLNPTNTKKTIWGIIQSALALSLMIGSSNGLKMLQTISIIAAFPFAIIMIFCMYSLVVALRQDEFVLKNIKND